jgi:succinylglutamate desuccinylase
MDGAMSPATRTGPNDDGADDHVADVKRVTDTTGADVTGADDDRVDERLVGRLRGDAAGACVVVVAGIHGNEPAGLRATRRVLRRLQALANDDRLAVRGDVVVVAGNVASLRQRQRYALRDLNRGWDDDSVAALRARDPGTLQHEDAEQRELLDAVDTAFAHARGPRVLVDLHTSSAPGIPFVLFGDTVAQIDFVGALPIPALLGLVEQVDGILAEYWTRRGAIAFCVEGGQHDDPGAVDNLAAAMWMALARAGVIDATLPEVAHARALLDARRAGLPRLLEVVRRHAITADDAFVMEPGFLNIASVARGRLLARDRRGEIRAPDDGAVVLPLYQKLGSDGFFWARPVSSRRMKLADLLRRLPVDALAPLLPGVDDDAEHPHRVLVRDDAVGATLVRRVLTLFGFRRRRPRADGRVVVERLPG